MSAKSKPSGPSIEIGWSSERLHVRDEKEDWTGITNQAERRKLQNRLNQRARRLRARGVDPGESLPLRYTPRRGRPPSARILTGDGTEDAGARPSGTLHVLTTARAACINAEPQVEALMGRFVAHAYASYVQGTPVVSHLNLLVKYNVSSALKRNAELLGIISEYHDWNGISPFTKQGPASEVTSCQQSSNWPANLLPTELQRSTEHHPWVDVFPWPRVRDNLLQAFEHPELCDEDELCHDICEYDYSEAKTALIVWGASWDPRSWEASIEFLKKWGWLLCGCKEALDATNYWRTRRGEKAISVKEFYEFVRASAPAAIGFV